MQVHWLIFPFFFNYMLYCHFMLITMNHLKIYLLLPWDVERRYSQNKFLTFFYTWKFTECKGNCFKNLRKWNCFKNLGNWIVYKKSFYKTDLDYVFYIFWHLPARLYYYIITSCNHHCLLPPGWTSPVGYGWSRRLRPTQTSLLPGHRRDPHVFLHWFTGQLGEYSGEVDPGSPPLLPQCAHYTCRK